MSVERPLAGTSLPVKIFTSWREPPDGYLVGITRIKILSCSVTIAFNALIASGLLSSMPIIAILGVKMCCRIFIPTITSAA